MVKREKEVFASHALNKTITKMRSEFQRTKELAAGIFDDLIVSGTEITKILFLNDG
jgi:hypothetical protein